MGVFEKLPYLNYHDINLDWLVRQTKKNASDNTYLMKIFKWFQDNGLVGVVTDITENPDDTVKIEYTETETQTTDDFTVYNKTGADNAISGAQSAAESYADGVAGTAETNAKNYADTAIGNAFKGLSSLPAETDLQNTDLLLINRSGAAKSIAGSVVAKQSDMTTAQTNITNLQTNKQNAGSILTNDVLADAVALPGYRFQWYVMGGSSGYTGTLPSDNYKNGSAIAIKRTENQIAVVVFPWLGTDPIIYNIYTSGTWSGWKSISFT